jgi:hypothetical protein
MEIEMSELDEKALSEAQKAYNLTGSALAPMPALRNAIRAYLAASPAPTVSGASVKAQVDSLAARENAAAKYDQGRRDILNAILAPNPTINAKLAKWSEREPDPDGRLSFDVVLWVTEVAAQLGIDPRHAALSVIPDPQTCEICNGTGEDQRTRLTVHKQPCPVCSKLEPQP